MSELLKKCSADLLGPPVENLAIISNDFKSD